MYAEAKLWWDSVFSSLFRRRWILDQNSGRRHTRAYCSDIRYWQTQLPFR